MEITPAIPADRQVIGGYGSRFFRISGKRYETSVLVFVDRILSWPITSFDEITADSFLPVHEAVPPIEVLLLGAGDRNVLVPSALRTTLRDAGIIVDAMDTGAACRTYNIMMAEDRRVAAALIALT